DEPRMIVEGSDLVEGGRPFTRRLSCADDVLAVLATPGIAGEPRGHERDRAPDAVVAHPPHRILYERAPVAVAKVDGQVGSACRELGLERGDERPVLLVDGAHAPEVLVMARHRKESL